MPRRHPPLTTRVKALTHDLDQEEMAAKRIGATPKERLEWVIGFCRRDFAAVLLGEREGLSWNLRALTSRGWLVKRRLPAGPLDLESLQDELAASLRKLFTENVWYLPLSRPFLARVPIQGRRATRYVFETGFAADAEGDAILQGIAELVRKVGRDFRACEQCGNPFVAVKRQDYCSPVCAQARRNDRRRKTSRRRTVKS